MAGSRGACLGRPSLASAFRRLRELLGRAELQVVDVEDGCRVAVARYTEPGDFLECLADVGNLGDDRLAVGDAEGELVGLRLALAQLDADVDMHPLAQRNHADVPPSGSHSAVGRHRYRGADQVRADVPLPDLDIEAGRRVSAVQHIPGELHFPRRVGRIVVEVRRKSVLLPRRVQKLEALTAGRGRVR